MAVPRSARVLVVVLGWVLGLGGGAIAVRGDEPVLLTTQHVDLRVTYDARLETPLGLVASDDDAHPARDYASTNCILVVADSTRIELPADIPPLGAAGDSLWVLSASQAEGSLYLGLSAEGIPSGIFTGPLQIRLLGVEGPGAFFLWQADLGALQFYMNSRDGVGDSEGFPQLVGGHSHANWGFSTTGVYRVTLQAEGRRVGESTNVLSSPATFTFHVLPLPPIPLSPFERWQSERWPGVTDPVVVGPEADPDGDQRPNLWEYFQGTEPRAADAEPESAKLRIALETTGAGTRAVFRLSRRSAASDVRFHLESAEQPGGPWAVVPGWEVVESAQDEWTRIEGIDPRGIASSGGRFYRLALQLEPSR